MGFRRYFKRFSRQVAANWRTYRGQNLSITRAIHLLFGILAVALLITALGDVMLDGRLDLMPPVTFGALMGVVLAFLLYDFIIARERAELLDKQTEQLKLVAARAGILPGKFCRHECAAESK